MALDMTQLNERVERFNKEYGVNFNIGTFNVESMTLSPNTVFKKSLVQLYRKAIGNSIDKKIPPLNTELMVAEFADIMDSYRKGSIENGVDTSLLPLGGWTGAEALDHLKQTVTDKLPRTTAGFARRRYLEGDLRIRDMMGYTKEAFANGKEPDLETAKVIASYAMGLKSAHESRSTFWKIIHPFRNNAEKRDYKAMQDMLLGMKDQSIAKEAAAFAGGRDDRERDAFAEVKNDIASCIEHSTLLNGYGKQRDVAKNVTREKIQVMEAVSTENKKTVEKVKEAPASVKEKYM